MIGEVIARLISESLLHSTISTRTIPIYFQRFPGLEAAAGDRGIADLEYQVLAPDGTVLQTGRTGPDGLISCRVRGASSTLQLLWAGTAISEYTVSIDDAALDAVTGVRGRQQRLMMLGYDVGAAGVDGSAGGDTEKAMLNFQADKGLALRGTVGATERNALTADAGE
ncbi:MAG TPA: peptidoglycan-binding domain-containing protein [Gammaproteobacteria bacterium]|nr:peptidoglycan-binding domain-containing protein [Gammaproteobacteria bacterium]